MEETCFAPGLVPENRIDCFNDNTVVYVARYNIVILRNGSKPLAIYNAHYKGINDIVAAPSQIGEDNTLKRSFITCGNDGFVRLWSLDTLEAVKVHQTHISRGSENSVAAVRGVDWSRVNPNLVVSVADNGCIVKWYLAENVTSKFSIGRANFTSVACSSTNEDIIAAASGGALYLIRFTSTTIKPTTLRIFQKGISHMAWQPNGEKMCLTSSYGELAIWDMSIPKRVASTHLNSSNRQQQAEQYPVQWIDEKKLIWKKGNSVVMADNDPLCFADDKPIKSRVLHNLHKRAIFAMASRGSILWSLAADRTIISFNLTTSQMEQSIGTLFGGSYCAAVSPYDANLVALGNGDGNVRIWDVTKPTGTCSSEHRNIADKVLSVCWHPSKDTLLIYGTSAGRVGVMDRSNKSNEPYLLKEAGASGKSVYWLSFGPKFLDAQANHILYVVTSGKIFVYDDLSPKTNPVDFTQQLNLTGVRDCSWKQDFSLLAVCCQNGFIYFYVPGCLEAFHKIPAAQGMQYLAWHPMMTSSETDISPYHNLLTFGHLNPDGDIHVYKITKVDSSVESSVFATLKGHKGYIQSVSWSPHLSGQLVSTSDDNSIQIWNVLTETAVANFRTTHLAWFSIWSPIHPDFIISGTKDSTIFIWKISAQEYKEPPENVIVKKVKKKKPRKIEKGCEEAKEPEITSQTKNWRKDQQDPNHRTTTQMANFVPQSKTNQSILTNLWSKSSSSEFRNCRVLLETSDDSDRSNSYRLDFLKSDLPGKKLSQLEDAYKPAEQIDALTSIMLYQGKLKELIEQKINDGGLTDNLVALAPSVSPRLWQAACIAYARQLGVAKQFTKAANYLVMGRQAETATEVLCEGGLFLDALCLAKHHSTNQSLFDKIVRMYGEDLESKGDFARASECYIYVKDYEQVIRCLSRSHDPEALLCAALAAQKTEKRELFERNALLSCANDLANGSSKMIQFFSTNLLPAKLLWTVYKCLDEMSESQPLFERIAEDINLNDAKNCYAVISSLQPTNMTSVENKKWRETQQISLAFCVNDNNDPRRLRPVLNILETAYAKSKDDFVKTCRLFSPNLRPDGIFATDHTLGISLRSFLCFAILYSTVATELLPLLKQLEVDLLDEKAFIYQRSKTELTAIQNKFPNTLINVSEMDEETKEMLSKRGELILKISKIERERCVIPNPVMGFMLLRNIYHSLSGENNTAANYLELLEEKYSSLIR